MVARRRLKRPPRRAAHLKAHRARVSLAQAAVDRVASKVDQDVAKMRSEIARDDQRRSGDGGHTDVEDDVETEVEGDAMGQSVEDEFASTFDSEKDPGPSQGSPIFGSCASSLRRKVIDMLIRAIIKRGSSKDTLNDFDHQMYAHTFDLLRNP